MTPNRKLAAMFDKAGLQVIDRGPVRENALAYLWRSLGPADVQWLEEIFRRERATIAHLHTFASHVVGTRAARRANLPILRTEHHVQYFIDRDTAPFTRWSLARIDASVAVSQYVANAVVALAPEVAPKMHVVRNGVDATYFEPQERSAGVARRPFTFVVVCRLEAWKGIDLVIEAAALSKGFDVEIVGEGSERKRLEALVTARGLVPRVRFLGYLPDPRGTIADADAFVSASKDEPLGLSVLEALAMARPVVAFAGGGIPEIVQHGETGWLVTERTAEALGRAMAEAAADRDRARMVGEAGRRFVDSECRVEKMCEGYAAIYEKLT